MTYDAALNKTKAIIDKFPHYILCGSLALMYTNNLPQREVGDLDFICFRDKFNSNDFPQALRDKATTGDSWVYVRVNNGYLCYEIEIDKDTHYNVFVFDNSNQIIYSNVNGILVQNIGQIISYKQLYNREKDIEDLGNII